MPPIKDGKRPPPKPEKEDIYLIYVEITKKYVRIMYTTLQLKGYLKRQAQTTLNRLENSTENVKYHDVDYYQHLLAVMKSL